MKKTCLVTGGAGFIGSNFINYMLNKHSNFKIVNLDKLTYAGNLENLKNVENSPNYKFIKADICNEAIVNEIFKTYEIDYVVNFAAESHVDRSIQNPEIFIKTNVLGTANLLNCAKKSWLLNSVNDTYKPGVKFLQISTDEVYGSLGNDGFFFETTKLSPNSPYSASKASADFLVEANFRTYKMPINITRCSNNYGPFQFPEKLIPLTINNILNSNNIPIYGDGLNVRDWLHVADHCCAIDLVLQKGEIGEIYNVGGCNEKTNLELVQTIVKNYEQLTGEKVKSKIKHVVDRKGHDRRYAINPSKIKVKLGFEPKFNFESGIMQTVEWFLNNKKWLNNVVSGNYKNYYAKTYGSDFV